MTALLHGTVQKVAVAITVFFATIGGVLTQPNVIVITPRESAVVQIALAPTAGETSSSSIPSAAASSTGVEATSSPEQVELLPVAPGLLPKVHPLHYKIMAGMKTEIGKSSSSETAFISNSAAAPTPSAAPKTITAQWLLEKTTLSLRQKLDGFYEVILNTAINNKKNLGWGLSDATFGGGRSIPQFSSSFSCDPSPDFPMPDASDQNPFFSMRTSYRCTISLTPSAGSDKRTRSKEFSFQTGAGRLVVVPSLIMNTVLRNDKNSGGFVFDNKDTQPVTITSLKFDISYTALSTSSNPLIIRFIDSSEQTLSDYHIEDLPADPLLLLTQSRAGIEVPLSFAVGPNNQKLLEIQALGVRKMNIPDVDPAIKITLRGVTSDQGDVKIIFGSPQILWTCTFLPMTSYDPNATSGAFATGQVCRD